MIKYLVGGAVRDIVMGLQPKDLDYVIVGSDHEEMIRLGYHKVGADFPVYLDSLGREHALARTERSTGLGYNDFDVKFGPDVTIEDDLIRRDFTMNAMAMDLTTDAIIDPYGGCEDIQNRTIEVTNPTAFHEDPVRVLRACRFAARYKFDISEMTRKCIYKCIDDGRMKHLTSDRVWLEFAKAISDGNFDLFVMNLASTGASKELNLNLSTMGVFFQLFEQIQKIDDRNVTDINLVFGTLVSVMAQEDYDAFCSVLRLPSDVKFSADLIRLYRGIMLNPNAVAVVDMIKACKAQQTPVFFNVLMAYNELICGSIPMIDCHCEYFGVDSRSFPLLSGKDLGDAIKIKRIDTIRKLLTHKD